MTDSEKQREFLAGLRKAAEAAAANNPVLADKRTLAKALVAELRARFAVNECNSLGAYMENDGEVSMVPSEGESSLSGIEIISKLKSLAAEGKIRSAAFGQVRDRQIPAGPVVNFIQVHTEHVAGKPFLSAVPVNESASTSVPGIDGPSLGLMGGPTKPLIFIRN